MKKMENKKLTDKQKKVLFEKGTEAPFSGELVSEKRSGVYTCANCGAQLFSSDAKFESGTGWPSFDNVVEEGTVELREDTSHGMVRTEVVCAKCGGHLGHLFDDGPADTTGKRYCINSCVLDFEQERNETN